MKTATSLTVIAIGAIFAFAITATPTFLNLQVVGWILMLTGIAGLLLHRRSRDWFRRTVIVRGGAGAGSGAGSARTATRPGARRRPPRQIAPPATPAPATPAPAPADFGEPVPAPAEPLGSASPQAPTAAETTLPDQPPVPSQQVVHETIEEYIEP